MTLIALTLVAWVLAILFVLVILRGVALADRDAARLRAEMREEAATAARRRVEMPEVVGREELPEEAVFAARRRY